ncbi:hypothetical protein PO002_35600 [Cupriavidus necator]|uniref:hypothetical protein n=1 Tax=Cupriavidus necator TaxID=106590 RepID=UPI0039C369E6
MSLSPILDAAIKRVADAASVLSDDERMELVGYANRGRAKVNGPALRSSKPSLSDSQCRLLAREAAAFAKTPIR